LFGELLGIVYREKDRDRLVVHHHWFGASSEAEDTSDITCEPEPLPSGYNEAKPYLLTLNGELFIIGSQYKVVKNAEGVYQIVG